MGKQLPQKSRLGRGLSSLMNLGGGPVEVDISHAAPSAKADAPSAESSAPPLGVRVLDVPLEQITVNPHQPRRRFDEQSLKELADSLRTTGVIQPVVARGTSDSNYELIAGERRWRAAKLAGLRTLPVIVRSVDPVMQAQMALVENLQREDLNPIDRAHAYRTLLDNLGLTQAELADRLGEDRTVIGHHLRLLEFAPAVQEMIADGRLSVSHAKVLAGVSDPAQQTKLAELAVSQGLNIRNLERLTLPPPPPKLAEKSPAAISAHLQDLEKSLSRHLGMRVQVKASSNRKKGRLILHYASLDQFDDLMSRLGLSPE